MPYRLLSAALLLSLSACAPTFSPAYLDYAPTDDAPGRLAEAVAEAGWTPLETPAPALTTRPRTFTQVGLYRIEAHLEVLPMAAGRVRVLVHPYRVYFDGARSKIGYLPASLRRAIAPELTEAFEAHGFEAALEPGAEPEA